MKPGFIFYMKYNKLVRDNIPEIIVSKGATQITHVADEKEYEEKLIEKLGEEIEEFRRDRNEEELADMLEVVDALITYKGFDKSRVEEIQKKKAIERGKFEKRIILDETIEV